MGEKKFINAEQMKGDIRIAMAEQLHKDPFNLLPTHLAELLCKFVDDTDAADVVEVVRCKDCAKRNTPDCAMWYRCKNCDGQWSWETNNDFCSYGERKEQT